MKLLFKIIAYTACFTFFMACKESPKKPTFSGAKHSGNIEENPDNGIYNDDPELEIDPSEKKKKEEEGVKSVLSNDDKICKDKPRGSGRKSLRLLTKAEYANSLRDILKVTADPTGAIPSETKVNGFPNNIESNRVTANHLIAYVDTAISIADSIRPNLQSLIGCTEANGAVCAQKLVDTIAPKLFRRPLTQEEKTFALSYYQKGSSVSPREGMTLLISNLLTSPNFLYRSEIGDSQGKLDPYEVASALSFFFWGSSPDDALTASATSGKLLTEDGLKAEALRLWKNPRSRFVTDEFAYAWLDSRGVLGATKDPSVGTDFTPDIQRAMLAEANDTFDFLMKQPKATFESLMASDFTVGSPALANFYRAQSITEEGVTKIKFGNSGRKGLVTLGGGLASHSRSDESHPIKRGDFVLQKMLCFIPPPTPPGVEVVIPKKDPSKTTRERFAAHSSEPTCKGCHAKLDGVGFGLEDYDTLGRFRDKDLTGKAIDASGKLVDVDKKDTEYSGGGELAELLSKSSEAKRCFAIQWYRYAHGRAIGSADPDLCATRDLAVQFSEGKIPLGELLIKIITDSSYIKRGE